MIPCEFTYDEPPQLRVLIRQRSTPGNFRTVYAMLSANQAKEAQYEEHLNTIEDWLIDTFAPESYKVYRQFRTLVVAFDRLSDMVLFKLRWHE